jgi:succinoglycan biosynthesis protein ExoV
MKLFYCDVPAGNFGDDLNTYLWPRLLPDAFEGMVRFTPLESAAVDHEDARDTLFVGIGTLIHDKVPATGRKVVFGSGCDGSRLPDINGGWDIQCVRGPLTADALGLDSTLAIADPAILVRLLPPAALEPAHRVSFMPHWCQAQSGAWQKICRMVGIHFIDPRWPPFQVLEAISSTGTLISEALHGAIVADALRVPWIAVSSKHHIQDFKWRDWCASIGQAYEPVTIPAIWTPASGLRSRAVTAAKMAYGASVLTRLDHRTRLSNDAVIARLTDRLVEALESFANPRRFAVNLAPQY